MSQAAVPEFLQRLLGPQTAAASSEGAPLLNTADLCTVREAAGRVAFPERLQRLVAGLREAKVVAVAGGLAHTVAATSDGRAFMWGRHSALGLQADDDQLEPRECPGLRLRSH